MNILDVLRICTDATRDLLAEMQQDGVPIPSSTVRAVPLEMARRIHPQLAEALGECSFPQLAKKLGLFEEASVSTNPAEPASTAPRSSVRLRTAVSRAPSTHPPASAGSVQSAVPPARPIPAPGQAEVPAEPPVPAGPVEMEPVVDIPKSEYQRKLAALSAEMQRCPGKQYTIGELAIRFGQSSLGQPGFKKIEGDLRVLALDIRHGDGFLYLQDPEYDEAGKRRGPSARATGGSQAEQRSAGSSTPSNSMARIRRHLLEHPNERFPSSVLREIGWGDADSLDGKKFLSSYISTFNGVGMKIDNVRGEGYLFSPERSRERWQQESARLVAARLADSETSAA